MSDPNWASQYIWHPVKKYTVFIPLCKEFTASVANTQLKAS